MARYVDGFVIPLPKKKLQEYLRMAKMGAKVWREHGALAYYECIGEDLNPKMGKSFARQMSLKPGETVVFSWIVYKSKAHRDRVNAKIITDPRMNDPKMQPMPFDMKRFCYGGFDVLVSW